MSNYGFVVAKYVPDIEKFEPVNVGVLVKTGEKTFEGKFIENFRTLSGRYPDSNINSLKSVVEGFAGKYEVDSKDFLNELSNEYKSHLVFSKPSGIVAGTSKSAINQLFESFISIGGKTRLSRPLTRLQLLSVARKEITTKLEKKWIIRKHRVKGPRDHFEFDYAFKNGKVGDLLHAISFEGSPKRALTLAKALALTIKYVKQENDDIDCSALIHPPKDDKMEREFYEPAVGYLTDQQCSIKTEEQIPQYVRNVKRKLMSAN